MVTLYRILTIQKWYYYHQAVNEKISINFTCYNSNLITEMEGIEDYTSEASEYKLVDPNPRVEFTSSNSSNLYWSTFTIL